MSRTGISYQDVLDAVTALENQGIIPNIETVRGILGTGSNSTISSYLKLWRNGVHPGTVIRLTKEPTPDIVKDAVDRVWQDINAKASREVETIKQEAQVLINAADEKVASMEKELDRLQAAHDELQEFFRAQYSEKERLFLDFKKMSEEHTLLRERFSLLEQCYGDLKTQTSIHIEQLSTAHQHKIAQLTERFTIQSESQAQLLDMAKEQHHKEISQQTMMLDQLRADKKALNDTISTLKSELHEQITEKNRLETNLNIALSEHHQTAKSLMEQEKKWAVFNDKTFISTNVLDKIISAPMLDEWTSKIHGLLEKSFNDKMSDMKDFFKVLESEEKMES